MSLDSQMTALADAIRDKSGETGPLSISGMTSAVESIVPERTPKEYYFAVYDYDGTVLFESEADEGDVFDLPAVPPSHDGLVFDGWSVTQPLVNGKVVISGNDCLAGAYYHTLDDAVELYFTLTKATGLFVKLATSSAVTSIDWGDGYTDKVFTHTFSDYGDYTVKVYGLTSIPAYFVGTSSTATNVSLREVRFPSGITTISQNAFLNCLSLEKVMFGTGVQTLNNYCFKACRNLKGIVLPPNITTLNSSLFIECRSLECAVISTSVTTINSSDFSNCVALKRIVISSEVTSIGMSIVANNLNIERIILPDSVTGLAVDCFSGLVNLKEIRMPPVLTTIGNNAFLDCSSLPSLNIPSGPTAINQKFCMDCYNLTEITLPSGITSIGNSAFNGCCKLEEIIIPSTVTSLGTSVFTNCNNLKTVDFSSHTSVPTLGDAKVFSGVSVDCRIIVPAVLYDEWIAANYWSGFADYIVPDGIDEPVVYPENDNIHYVSVNDTNEYLEFGTSIDTPIICISNGTDTVYYAVGSPISLNGISGNISFTTDYWDEEGYTLYTQYEINDGGSLTFTAPGRYEFYGVVTVDGQTVQTGKEVYIVS